MRKGERLVPIFLSSFLSEKSEIELVKETERK